jgi:multicomponent Na+:H+ antiporter subunit G
MKIAVAAVLGLGVLAAWLAVAAYMRLRTPLQRLHALSFLNAVSGSCFLIGVWLSDGASTRALKSVLIWVMMLLVGALLAQGSARMLLLREQERR